MEEPYRTFTVGTVNIKGEVGGFVHCPGIDNNTGELDIRYIWIAEQKHS